MSKKKHIIIMTAIIILIGAGGFFGGRKYQSSKRPTFNNNQSGRFNGPNRQNFRPVNGEIISSDNQSITVKMPDASSRIVLVNDQTTINQATSATKADLKAGIQVAVFGQENNDGSLIAQSIQLNPQFRQNTQNQ